MKNSTAAALMYSLAMMGTMPEHNQRGIRMPEREKYDPEAANRKIAAAQDKRERRRAKRLKVTDSIDCPHNNYTTRYNIGFDVWDNGEEHQHLDFCADCSMSRLRLDRISFDGVINETVLLDWKYSETAEPYR